MSGTKCRQVGGLVKTLSPFGAPPRMKTAVRPGKLPRGDRAEVEQISFGG